MSILSPLRPIKRFIHGCQDPAWEAKAKGVGSICENLSSDSGCVEWLIAGDKKDKDNKASRIQKHPKQQESTGTKAKNKVP